MSAVVNLLLLLSALLSALTGVGASARQPQVAQAVARQAHVIAPRPVAAAVAMRPVQRLTGLSTFAVAPVAAKLAFAAAIPLYAMRRRE